VSRGRKEQRHACSVTGMQQYGRMEGNSASAPLANGSVGVKAAGKTGERETNAPNSFEAPQAAEGRETNAPCQRETFENTGTRETNVSEKEAAAARGDGRPPTITEQQQRQIVATATEHTATGELPDLTHEGATISGDLGPEEIPVLVDFEVQHWIAEALEGATRATGLIIGRVASMGVHRPNLGRKEAGTLDPVASSATQAMMRAATADPLSDAQLEQIVKLALGRGSPLHRPQWAAEILPRRRLRQWSPPATIWTSGRWSLRTRVRVTP
jgi:hypothetical protein